ncbi:MAG: hypothetical protein DK304_000724 [Chloroflexi bacterium]|nr:MAG: hypothetical protein DK304_000724 [Chloroflexota bacterium]
MTNRLINETSPYLLQHAENPVNWYPWCEEAFSEAKAKDKPIFLSVGYSACHWCHVMAHESFEDVETAKLMNTDFINIKVDREERPDVDSIYMRAVQAQTGRGGWPMSVFLTPDGKPFFGGTYFPLHEGHGIPSFTRVLRAISQAYQEQRKEITESAEQLIAHLNSGVMSSQGQEPLTSEILTRAFDGLVAEFDQKDGGFSTAPKFPQPMIIEFLLRYYNRTGQTEALAMADMTLEKMCRGGIYDQIGGGFHRYSTDAIWLVPHFEKMLYDNALLSKLYLHAYQITGRQEYKRIVTETLDYVIREMTNPNGGFYSSQDADSEGEEGKYFFWEPTEVEQILGEDLGKLINRYYGVGEGAHSDGENILHVHKSAEDVCNEFGINQAELDVKLANAKAKLLPYRQKRIAPGTDDKIITAWNGMMIGAFAEAAAVLKRADYLEISLKNATFILEELRSPSGRIKRTHKKAVSKLLGYLEDYANMIDGLISLHALTIDLKWLNEANSLATDMLNLFWDNKNQSFYDTGNDHEKLIMRPQDYFDNATPSGAAVASDVLLKLAILTNNTKYKEVGNTMLRSLRMVISRAPMGFGHWLCVLDFHLSTPKEIALVGSTKDTRTQELIDEVFGRFLPNKVVSGFQPGQGNDYIKYPLLKDKHMLENAPTAFVCQNYTCNLPTIEASTLSNQLENS